MSELPTHESMGGTPMPYLNCSRPYLALQMPGKRFCWTEIQDSLQQYWQLWFGAKSKPQGYITSCLSESLLSTKWKINAIKITLWCAVTRNVRWTLVMLHTIVVPQKIKSWIILHSSDPHFRWYPKIENACASPVLTAALSKLKAHHRAYKIQSGL